MSWSRQHAQPLLPQLRSGSRIQRLQESDTVGIHARFVSALFSSCSALRWRADYSRIGSGTWWRRYYGLGDCRTGCWCWICCRRRDSIAATVQESQSLCFDTQGCLNHWSGRERDTLVANSSVSWQVQWIHDTLAREYRGWWRKFFHWLGFHGWRLRDR